MRGSTRIPLEADVDTMEATPAQWHWEGSPEEMFNVRGVVTPRAGEVYLITTAVRQPWTGDLHVNTTYGGRLARMRDTTTNGRVVLIDEWYSFSRHDDLLGAVVSYDEPYYEFQRTYYRGDDMGPFGSGSDNVDWTVEGDGIGLFIGRNITMRPIED